MIKIKDSINKIETMFTPKQLLCPKCGKVEDMIVGHSMCLKCHDNIVTHKFEEEKRYIQQHKEDIILKAMEKVGIPMYQLIEYRNLIKFSKNTLHHYFEKLPEKEPWQLGYYIWGKVGTGKTTLALHIIYQDAENIIDKFGINVLKRTTTNNRLKFELDTSYLWTFVTATDMVSEVRAAKHFSSDSNELEILRWYSEKEKLVIDDLGSERISKDSEEVLFIILNERSRRGVQTIITSNLSLQDWRNRFQSDEYDQKGRLAGERLVSRMSGMLKAIEITGPDYRRNNFSEEVNKKQNNVFEDLKF